MGKNPPNSFRLHTTPAEWAALEEAAKASGKKNVNRFILMELHRFHNENKDLFSERRSADKKIKMITRQFPIPDELVKFYQNASDEMSTNISKIVYRFIILPALINENKRNVVLDMMRQMAITKTAAPSFTSNQSVSYTVKPTNQQPLS